jgi:hypothetical protein
LLSRKLSSRTAAKVPFGVSNIPWFLNGKPQRDDHPLTPAVILGRKAQFSKQFKTSNRIAIGSLHSCFFAFYASDQPSSFLAVPLGDPPALMRG